MAQLTRRLDYVIHAPHVRLRMQSTVGVDGKIAAEFEPAALDEILRSEWVPHLLSKEVTDCVGVFEWKKLVWLKAATRITPAHSGAGSAMRALLIFVVSLHGLHDMFIMRRGWG